jgi:hydrogenase maturation protease
MPTSSRTTSPWSWALCTSSDGRRHGSGASNEVAHWSAVKRRYLIGVGNETMTDDGIGPRVADALRNQARQLGFETILVGHDTLGILSYFDEHTERIVFVDCVRMERQPGDWLCFSPDDVETRRPLDRLTTHEGDVLRIIDLARQIGCPVPETTIVGIEPERVAPGLELSAALQSRFAEYVAAVASVLTA